MPMIKKMQKRNLIILILIIAVGVGLRLFFLSQHDFIGDENLNSLRAVGYFDSIYSPTQLAPVQIFDEEQWWQKFSFHDHPPLTYMVQHIFFKIFDDNVFIARLPFALVGILSILLIYLLASKLYNYQFGLLSALLLAVSNFHVWTSRVGLLEVFVIFFALLALIFTIESIKNPKWLLAVGISTGLALLSKYIAIFLLPLILAILFFSNKKIFKTKWFYFGLVLFLLVLTPVIIYNINFYLTRGHFDSTLSSMLNMQPEDFKGLERMPYDSLNYSGILAILIRSESLIFSVFSFTGLILLFFFFLRQGKKDSQLKLLFITLIFYLLFAILVFSGTPGVRFISIIIPAITMLAALFLFYFYQGIKNKRLALGVISFIAVFLFLFTFNSQLTLKPVGIKNLFYAEPLTELTWSYNLLDNYLEELFETQQAMMPVKSEYPQIKAFEKKQEEKILAQLKESSSTAESAFIFYDNRMNYTHIRWIFMRRTIYERRPIFDSESLLLVSSKGPNYFADLGFNTYYFIFTEPALLDRNPDPNHHAPALKSLLIKNGYEPIDILRDSKGDPLFSIFKTNSLLFLYTLKKNNDSI